MPTWTCGFIRRLGRFQLSAEDVEEVARAEDFQGRIRALRVKFRLAPDIGRKIAQCR